MGNILVCDDERSICEMLDIALRRDGHKVETVNSGEVAKRKLDGALYDVVVTDIKMPKVTGIEVLRHAHEVSPDTAVILITAVDDYEAAVQAVKAGGATDYIRKTPALVDEIKLAINRALDKVALSRQNFAFKRDAASRNSLDNIVGVSPAMEKLKQTIRTVASTQSTVLIYGESGTGLGLAIVYQIMQAHEGKVWARSKPGQGTVFVLRIRRASTARPQAGARKIAVSHQQRAAVAAQGAHG